MCFKTLPLFTYICVRKIPVMYETVIKSQAFIAVFFFMTAFLIDISVSALNVANKNVLVLLCKECARVGKIWGILFVLVRDSGYMMDPTFLILFLTCLYLKKWKTSKM